MEMKIVVNGKTVTCERQDESFVPIRLPSPEVRSAQGERVDEQISKSPFMVSGAQAKSNPYERLYTVTIDGTPHPVTATMLAYDATKKEARFLINDRVIVATNIHGTLATSLNFYLGNQTITCSSRTNDLQPASSIPQPHQWATPARATTIVSPLAGRVVSVLVQPAVMVTKGQPLVIIESMKMENEICAPCDAFIKTISIAPGNLVQTNQVLVTFDLKGEFDATTKSNHGQTTVSDR